MTPKEAEKKYGKKIFKKMQEELAGATLLIKENGELDIPESDLRRAYEIVTKGQSEIPWD